MYLCVLKERQIQPLLLVSEKALLSMSPLEGSVYENVAFEASETGDNCDNFEEVCIYNFIVIDIICNA